MTTGLLDVVIEEPGWLDALPDFEDVAQVGARASLSAVGLVSDDFAVSILACNDRRIAELNAEFRGTRRPTNVLSWPAFDLAPTTPGHRPSPPPQPVVPEPQLLGDVAIALQTCNQEAHSSAIPLKNHVTHLILHGCLHLLGFDHQTEADAALMEEIERTALEKHGIPDPYR